MLDTAPGFGAALPVDALITGLNTTAKAPAGSLTERLAALALLNHAELRAEWRRLFRANPPQRIGRDVLELGVAWKLQERALGGTSAGTKRRLSELARVMESKGDLVKARPVRLRPGAKVVRESGGETHEVFVTEGGFLWRGETWRSLSAIAREITGTHWSGPRFFGLLGAGKREGEERGAAEPAAAAAVAAQG